MWKMQPCSKTELHKRIGQIPIHKKKVHRKKFQWCQKCGKNRKWILSHDTATRQDDFKQKQNWNGNKHLGQFNSGEGLVPDSRCWIAEFQYDKLKSQGRSQT